MTSILAVFYATHASAQLRPQLQPNPVKPGSIAPRVFNDNTLLVEKPWEQLSDRDINDKWAGELMDKPQFWRHGETPNFVVHFRGEKGQKAGDSMLRFAKEAGKTVEFYYAQAKLDFGLGRELQKGKNHLFLVDPPDWSLFCQTHDLDVGTASVNRERWLFVYAQGNVTQDLAFPVATCVLYRSFQNPIPIWIRAGIGEFEKKNAFQKFKGIYRSTAQEFVSYFPLQIIIRAEKSYPKQSPRNFAATCGLVVEWLYLLDSNAFASLLLKLGAGVKFQQAIVESYPKQFKNYDDFTRRGTSEIEHPRYRR